MDRRVGRDEGTQEERRASVHHEQAAAGGALPRQEDDDDRAAAVRRHRAAGRRARSASSPTCEPTRCACPTRRSRTCAATSARSSARSSCRSKPNVYKTKADAQDAHEAIRPTSMQYDPESVRAQLTPDRYYLYRLIWNRFVASQMPPATFDETTVDIHGRRLPVPRQGIGAQVRRLAGGLQTRRPSRSAPSGTGRPTPASSRGRGSASSVLPALSEGDTLELQGAEAGAEVHAAPAALQRGDARQGARRERHRPAEHLRVDHQRLQARDYVNKIDGRFRPTMLGMMLVEKLLHPAFDDILDVEYTAQHGRGARRDRRRARPTTRTRSASFYKKFQKDLKRAARGNAQLQGRAADRATPATSAAGRDGREGRQVRPLPRLQRVSGVRQHDASSRSPSRAPRERLEETCENCGKPMVVKRGRFGSSWPAPAIPSARRRARSSRPSRG